METISINPVNPGIEAVSRASSLIRSGGIVICPTDTAYALAADAASKSCVEKIFAIKERDYTKPIHIIVSDLEMAGKYVHLNREARKLAEKFLPGPLTLILQAKGNLPEALGAGTGSIGIRIPSLNLNLQLAKHLDGPYTATSANKSGGPTSYTPEDTLSQLSGEQLEKIDLILDAGRLTKVSPSTILDCSNQIVVLREGPVPISSIEEALGFKVLSKLT